MAPQAPVIPAVTEIPTQGAIEVVSPADTTLVEQGARSAGMNNYGGGIAVLPWIISAGGGFLFAVDKGGGRSVPHTPVPEPASLIILGAGAAGIIRKRRSNQSR